MSERLNGSLDADPEIEEAWAAEVERRQAEIENGAVPLLPRSRNLSQAERGVSMNDSLHLKHQQQATAQARAEIRAWRWARRIRSRSALPI